MGADTFFASAQGQTAKEAFDAAVKQAQYDYGHAGYTGTIAEKSEFVMIPYDPETNGSPDQYADRLIEEGDDRIDDKWGPAGCFKIGPDVYYFFGWASS